MLDCTVTANPIKSELTVVVIGHTGARLPKLVEAEAARIAKGECGAPLQLISNDGRYLLVKLDEKPWLIGGENWRLMGREIVDAVRHAKLAGATVLVGGNLANVQALTEGILLADYRFNLLRSGKDAKRTAITISVPAHAASVKAGVAVAQAQNLARELADLPPNLMNPQTFAQRVQRELRGTNAKLKITSGADALRKAGFPGLAQVGEAGSVAPCLVEIHYVPDAAKKTLKNMEKLALVGKGITFDSGGISLKPGDKMWEMKGDMGGAAAVYAAAKHLIDSAIDLPFSAYLCLAENMPDSSAQRPGDIYRARNGKFIHVDNTDAEGRLVLADVLTFACEQGATHVVDAATLTGACMVALGNNIGGLMGRSEAWLTQVRAAGQEAGEELWPLPLYGEYRAMIDHPHADVNNTGGRYGGAITAGLFLSEFVSDKVQWAHLDIAGPAIQTGGWRYYAKGMSGFATRTLIRLAHKLVA